MIRSCLVFPELGLVRVSNCPIRAKEYMKEARRRRDKHSFNWQLSETVKNIRKYKHKQHLFLHAFKQVLNKFHVYDPFIGDMILPFIKDTPVPRYYQMNLKNYEYHLKIQILFSNLKNLGYSDIQLPHFTDFEIEMSFIKSVKYVSPELYEQMRYLYENLSKMHIYLSLRKP